MGIPLEGSKKIVGITGPCGTEEVTVTGGRLDVNAVIPPPVLIPVIDVPNFQVPFDAGLPLVFPFIPGAQHKLGYITAAFAGLTPGSSITVKIIFTFAAGAAFDTIVVSETFVADALGAANFFAEFNYDRAVGDGYIVDATTRSVAVGGSVATIISIQ